MDAEPPSKSKSAKTKDDLEPRVNGDAVGSSSGLHILENYPKLRRKTKAMLNEEETSSTTTESSNTDDFANEKETIQTYETNPNQANKNKKKPKKSAKAPDLTRQNSQPKDDNAGFEVR